MMHWPNNTIEAYTGNHMGHKGDRTLLFEALSKTQNIPIQFSNAAEKVSLVGMQMRRMLERIEQIMAHPRDRRGAGVICDAAVTLVTMP